MSTSTRRAGVVCLVALSLAAGCHRNFDWFDEAESALGRPTGHDAAGVAMVPFKGQRTCPVSGEKLGSAGAPIPLKVKGELIYVCCASCVEKAKADPDGCLAKVKAERAKTAAKPIVPDLGPYGGQVHCPVSGDELEADGSSRDVVVQGERIFVCCNDCAVRVRSNFPKYFPKVKAERDAALAAAMARLPGPDEGDAAAKAPAANAPLPLLQSSEQHGPPDGTTPPVDAGATPVRNEGGIQ